MRTFVVLFAVIVVVSASSLKIAQLRNKLTAPGFRDVSARSVQGSCTPPPATSYTCVAPGGKCNSSSTSILCEEGFVCGEDQTCPLVAGIGQPCAYNCSVGLECHPVFLTCVREFDIKPPGASCSGDIDCVFQNTTGTYAICQSGTCYGVPLGQNCDSDEECSGRAFCDGNTCKALIPEGGTCNFQGCVESAVCTQSVCIRIGTQATGGMCDDDFACNVGLYCDENSQTCETAPADNVACNVNSDCILRGTTYPCQCVGTNLNTTCDYNANANDATLISTLLAFGDCSAAQNCVDLPCVSTKCASQYCAYRKYVLSEFSALSDNCYYQHVVNQISSFVIPSVPACTSSTGFSINPSVSLAVSFAFVMIAFL